MVLDSTEKQDIVDQLRDIIICFKEESEPVHIIRDNLLGLVDRLYCEEYESECEEDDEDDED
jgi:hypothetical protein